MPPLLQQVRGATVLTIYMTDTPSNLPVAYTNMQTTSVHDKMHHRGWRGVRVFFHPEREKSLPEINPCLRVLIPSPSWIGLTHFDSFFFFFLPLNFERTQQQVPRLLLALLFGLMTDFWTRSSDIENIYFPLLPPHLPTLFLPPLFAFSLSLFLHFIFLLVTAAVVFYESGGFFLPGFL